MQPVFNSHIPAMQQSDVIIIGGGIIGLLTALHLRQAGASVTVLERNSSGLESSWAGGGIISPLYPWRYLDAVTRLAQWGQQHYQALCEQLSSDTGIDPQWTQSGLLFADMAESEQQTAVDWCQNWEVPFVAYSDAAGFADAEPSVTNITGGILLPEVAQVRNPRLVKALYKQMQRIGVSVRTDTAVVDLKAGLHDVIVIDQNGNQYTASQAIISGGAWSGALTQLGGSAVAVAPVKGQMILYKAEPQTLQTMILRDGHYLIPRRDGRILAGSTLEPEAGFSKQPTDVARSELHQFAISLLPALANYPIEHHWGGLRPGSAEERRGLPFIGVSPASERIFVNSGHYRNGVVLGLGSAKLMAEVVLQQPTFLPVADYSW